MDIYELYLKRNNDDAVFANLLIFSKIFSNAFQNKPIFSVLHNDSWNECISYSHRFKKIYLIYNSDFNKSLHARELKKFIFKGIKSNNFNTRWQRIKNWTSFYIKTCASFHLFKVDIRKSIFYMLSKFHEKERKKIKIVLLWTNFPL